MRWGDDSRVNAELSATENGVRTARSLTVPIATKLWSPAPTASVSTMSAVIAPLMVESAEPSSTGSEYANSTTHS